MSISGWIVDKDRLKGEISVLAQQFNYRMLVFVMAGVIQYVVMACICVWLEFLTTYYHNMWLESDKGMLSLVCKMLI